MRATFHPDDVAHGSEVNFLGSDEEKYPQLTRLFLDFDFRVLALGSGKARPGVVSAESFDSPAKYLITWRGSRDRYHSPVSPAFDSLPDLENYTNDNIIDILHQTVFASGDDEA